MMNTKPLISGESLIEFERKRYDELLAKEERLRTMETAITSLDFYNPDFEVFKRLFGLKENGAK